MCTSTKPGVTSLLVASTIRFAADPSPGTDGNDRVVRDRDVGHARLRAAAVHDQSIRDDQIESIHVSSHSEPDAPELTQRISVGTVCRFPMFGVLAMATQRFDAVVVGAGFAGLYMMHLLRGEGLSVKGLERAGGVGGTWYWNRYPGCRCDVESLDYSYQFSDPLQQEWVWSERYSAQPEILAYAEHVAKRFDLQSAHPVRDRRDERALRRADAPLDGRRRTQGDVFDTRFLIMATGCLSAANTPDFPGLQDFKGRTFHTGLWPQHGVDFTGRRVGIIGTGSSAIQAIPIIAADAADLTVFQRTANFSVPARNRPSDPTAVARVKSNYPDYRRRARQQSAAFGPDQSRGLDSVLAATPEERQRRFEEYWQLGGFMFLGAFGDLMLNEEANAYAAEFVRSKIRETVKDPRTAELLCPKGIIGCKRLCADTGYFETYNRDNVHLVDVSQHPIERFTATGARDRRHRVRSSMTWCSPPASMP